MEKILTKEMIEDPDEVLEDTAFIKRK